MNNSNKLLAALDATFGFPNKTSSTFRKLKQSYDNKRGQHVIWLAYIVKVNPGDTEKPVVKSQPWRGVVSSDHRQR